MQRQKRLFYLGSWHKDTKVLKTEEEKYFNKILRYKKIWPNAIQYFEMHKRPN